MNTCKYIPIFQYISPTLKPVISCGSLCSIKLYFNKNFFEKFQTLMKIISPPLHCTFVLRERKLRNKNKKTKN